MYLYILHNRGKFIVKKLVGLQLLWANHILSMLVGLDWDPALLTEALLCCPEAHRIHVQADDSHIPSANWHVVEQFAVHTYIVKRKVLWHFYHLMPGRECI